MTPQMHRRALATLPDVASSAQEVPQTSDVCVAEHANFPARQRSGTSTS